MASERRTLASPGNRLLAKLPPAEFRRLTPLLKLVNLARDYVVCEARGQIEYAYFPSGAVFSAIAIMADGNAIEVATVGNEGLVGHAAVVGDSVSPHKIIVQINGTAWRIELRALRAEYALGGGLQELLIHYQAAYISQISQSVACNGLHRLEQRCCRWLLMTRDRTDTDAMELTHDYLAIMLGARRASISETLKPLQEAGLILSQRGLISILDRAGLEARVCECYGVVRDKYDQFLGRQK